MENNNNSLKQQAEVAYAHKRFPTIFQGILAPALMQPVGSIIAVIILFVIQTFVTFKSEFGEYLSQVVLSQFFFILIFPLFFVVILKKDAGETFRLKKGIDLTQLLLLLASSVGLFFVLQYVNSIFIEYLSVIFGEPSPITDEPAMQNIQQLLFSIVVMAGLPAIGEELFFRGLVLRAFERKSTFMAILMSSIIFSVMHGNFQQIVCAFFMGIITGSLVILTDSLVGSMVLHFVFNTFASLISYPPIFEKYETFVTHYPQIFSVILSIFIGISVVSIIFFIKYTKNKNQREYGSKFVTSMPSAELMPQRKPWEKVMSAFAWVAFIGYNVISMFQLWFYDDILEFLEQIG